MPVVIAGPGQDWCPPLPSPPAQVDVDLARFFWGDYNGDAVNDLLTVANGGK